MADNTINWGQATVNNDINFGGAKVNSTNGFGAVYENSPSGDTDIVGIPPFPNNKSISFDGVDDYIDVGNPTELQITGGLSISYWFKTTNTGYQFLVTKDDGSNSCFGVGLRQDKILATIYGSGLTYVETTTTWTDGIWHNVVFVFTPSTSMEIFVNGNSELRETTGIPSSIDNDPANLNIGRRGNNTRLYTGEIDEIAIWDTALTSTQVSEIYNATRTNSTSELSTIEPSNLKLWFRMGDGDTFPTVTDNAGSNDGTMTNMDSSDIVNDTPPS